MGLAMSTEHNGILITVLGERTGKGTDANCVIDPLFGQLGHKIRVDNQ